MKVVSSYAHGVLDYPMGLILLLSPELFGFSGLGGPAEWTPRVVGIVMILQALMTNYELGLFKIISLQTHIYGDYFLGALLIASPWLLGFSGFPASMGVSVVFGILTLLVAVVTETEARRYRVPAI